MGKNIGVYQNLLYLQQEFCLSSLYLMIYDTDNETQH